MKMIMMNKIIIIMCMMKNDVLIMKNNEMK